MASAKRKAMLWESWEDDFVITQIRANATNKMVAELFAGEYPDRNRSEASIVSRTIVLRDRVRLDETRKAGEEARALIAKNSQPAPPKRVESKAEPGWRKVRAPKRWNPGDGESLEGTYLGQKAAEGQFGAYIQFHIAEESGQVWYVTGTMIEGLFTASMAQPGMKVRVVFLGKKECAGNEGQYKDFDLFVKEAES